MNTGNNHSGRSALSAAVPQLAATTIDRPVLLKRLDEVLGRPMTLVTGPAGAGKTALVAQWCHQRCPVPVVWLNVGRDDGLEQVMDAVAAEVTALTGVPARPDGGEWLTAGGSRPDRTALDRLADAAIDVPETVLVVDGLRPFGPTSLYGELALAFERSASSAVHLVTLSRCVAPTEITPLELRGTAGRIDADELRLDADEVAEVFASHSGWPIDEATGQALASRLDGWMAGVAIVGMSAPDDPSSSVDDLVDAAFDRIHAYLTYEVLNDFDDETRKFLTQLACVDEMTPPLCKGITGRSDSEGLLTILRMGGLPIVRGRSGTGSFRFLRPFREVLDAHAKQDDPDGRQAAIRMAAVWYSEQQRPFDAARCWVRLGDWDEVINVIMRHLQYILEHDLMSELVDIVSTAPPEVLHQHRGLALSAAWVLRMEGSVWAAYELLSIHQRWMTPGARMIADVTRGSMASWVEDPTGQLDFAEAAIAACDELGDDHFDTLDSDYLDSSTDVFRTLARAAALLASCYGGLWDRGAPHLVDIRQDTAANVPKMQLVQLRGWRATYLMVAGEVDRALSEARAALTVAADCGLREHRSSADALYVYGEAQRLAVMYDGVAEMFDESLALAAINDRRNLIATITASYAHLLVDTGDPEGALARLDELASTSHRLPRTVAGHVAAATARALAATGAHGRALRKLEAAEPTSVTASCRVAVCLARADLAGARRTVEQWPKEPTVDSAVRGALSAAVVADTAGDPTAANGAFRSALTTAADHRLVQPFVEFGPLIARLLRRVSSGGDGPAEDLARRVQAVILGGGVASVAPSLTARESVVLSHLAEGRSLPEVAKEIHLSVNTVKTHVKAIYRKLGASTRIEAINAWKASLAAGQDDFGTTELELTRD